MPSRRTRHKPSQASAAPTPQIGRGWKMADRIAPFLILGASLVSTILFLIRERAIAGTWGFSLDDSWIHATFAKNIATGHGFSFNPDESVGGSTAPLYTMLLAGLFWATKQIIWSGKAVGIICQATSAYLIYRASFRMNPRQHLAALLCGLLVALSPSLVWASVSGMEISLYLLALCLGLYFYVSGRSIPATAAW